MLNKTVAAISTARGKGGVALIRISGADALEIALKVFKCRSSEIEARKSYYGEILRGNEIIDDGILTYFKAPHSFTGEDVCEICCHGGVYVTNAVLSSVLSAGATLAGAGEFTKRAYINGRLTLSRAEAIGQVIDAKTDSQLRLSSSQARGVLSSKIDKIRAEIVSCISHAYATIDYPDEDITEIEIKEINDCLDTVIFELEALKRSYRTGKAVSEGVKTSIIGKPNAGKSSVYNMLLGEDAAIVTDIAGTTRDVIESVASVGQLTLCLADTAGIHDTEDTVEKIGVERAKKKIEGSELLLCVFDSSEKETKEDEFILTLAESKTSVALINKTDKPCALSKEFLEKIDTGCTKTVYLSAKTEDGKQDLATVLEQMYSLGEFDLSSDAVLSSARQLASVEVALERATESKNALLLGQTPDIICFSLESALSELDLIDRREVNEEIVSAIFSRFCVGK